MPVTNRARNVADVMARYFTRQDEHRRNGADGSVSKRKSRIFPLKDPNKHGASERKISGYTACGIVPGGEHKSIPGFPSLEAALTYGRMKGWTHRAAIASRGAAVLAFLIGAAVGVMTDRAQAGEITDNQAAIIGRIAVDAVAVQRCGFPQPADMFAGMEKAGMTIQSLTHPGGEFVPVMVRTIDYVWASYQDHPAQFCAKVASTRAR